MLPIFCLDDYVLNDTITLVLSRFVVVVVVPSCDFFYAISLSAVQWAHHLFHFYDEQKHSIRCGLFFSVFFCVYIYHQMFSYSLYRIFRIFICRFLYIKSQRTAIGLRQGIGYFLILQCWKTYIWAMLFFLYTLYHTVSSKKMTHNMQTHINTQTNKESKNISFPFGTSFDFFQWLLSCGLFFHLN